MNPLTSNFYFWLLRDRYNDRIWQNMLIFPNFMKFWREGNDMDMFIAESPVAAVADAIKFLEATPLEKQQYFMDKYRAELLKDIQDDQLQLELVVHEH